MARSFTRPRLTAPIVMPTAAYDAIGDTSAVSSREPTQRPSNGLPVQMLTVTSVDAVRRPIRRPGSIVIALVIIAAGTLLAPSEPGYDGWAWLLWGREVAAFDLDTVAGPAFKPLPVAVCAVLSLAGGAAPALWLVIARAGALAAVWLGGLVCARLGGHWLLGAAAVALCEGMWWQAAIGNSEGLFLALALGAVDCGLAGRHGWALAAAVGAALLRPEAWPFVALYGLFLFQARAELRPWLAAAAVAIPVVWFLPELWGSGDLVRSSERARIPNPGQPATADRPLLASLEEAAEIALVPLALAGLAALGVRRVRMLAVAGVAWVALVALMAEQGYSGEPRYALAGAAVVAVAGAAAAGRGRWAAALAVCALPFAVVQVGDVRDEVRRADDAAASWRALDRAIAAAGGRDPVLACGRPATVRYRGTGVAYALHVHKRVVAADGRPRSGAFLAPVGRSWEVSCVN